MKYKVSPHGASAFVAENYPVDTGRVNRQIVTDGRRSGANGRISRPAETVSSFGGTSPMGRPAQPAELAPAFVFLASQEASFVNGETLGVTGGQPMP